MKKRILPFALAALLLAACSTPETSSNRSVVAPASSKEETVKTTSSEATTKEEPIKNTSSEATTSSQDSVETGATDSGKGGLNFGDVDWSKELKEEAVNTYLSGINNNHREMMQVATVSNGNPQIASVEYYMDTKNHWFFGSSESDTGKIIDMKKNNHVALYWTRQLRTADTTMAPNYFTSYGVEVQGSANFYTEEQVNALGAEEKKEVISIARGYYQSMGPQYKKFYDSTADGYLNNDAFVTYVFGSKTQTPYIIKPSKIVVTSPYLLFVTRIDDESKADGHYYAFQQGKMTLAEYTFLPKAFLDKCLQTVRDAKNDQTLMKFTTMTSYTSASGLKTQVTLKF